MKSESSNQLFARGQEIAFAGEMAPNDGWHQTQKRRCFREWASLPCSDPGVGLVGPSMFRSHTAVALGVGNTNSTSSSKTSSLVVVDALPCNSLVACAGTSDDKGVGRVVDDHAVMKLHPAVEELLLNFSELLPDAQRNGDDSNNAARGSTACTDDKKDNVETVTIQSIDPGHIRVGRFSTKRLTEQKIVAGNQKVCVDLLFVHSDSKLFEEAIIQDCYKNDDAKMCVSGLPTSYMETIEQMGGVGVHRHRALLSIHHSLSGRLVARGSYVIMTLPPIWSSDTMGSNSWDLSLDPTSSLEADADEVAIFQVDNIQIIGGDDSHEDIIAQQSPIPPLSANAYAIAADGDDEKACYRLIDSEEGPMFSIRVFHHEIKARSLTEADEEESKLTGPTNDHTTCPGYEGLLNELLRLAKIHHTSAAPSGVMLTGCTGVGKSRVASCLADRLLEQGLNDTRSRPVPRPIVHRVSAKDILLAAASRIDVKLLTDHVLGPAKVESIARRVLIIDDLDSIFDPTGEESSGTPDLESALAVNAIVGAIDFLVKGVRHVPDSSNKNASAPFILGLCCASNEKIPGNFVRVGRFEKVITMAAPTQHQRERIFQSMLESLPLSQDEYNKRKVAKKWAMTLAPQTAGFVASDIRRVCADALTRSQSRCLCARFDNTASLSDARIAWHDVRESARICVPSQLAKLDVTSTSTYSEEVHGVEFRHADSSRIAHEKAWSIFGGYQGVKERIYRTVVRPWIHDRIRQEDETLKTFNNATNVCGPLQPESESDLSMGIPPPSGVLFHGPSGVGKTMAAQCLASSMSLPVVKVAAADILDQWLGGSEAAIRSLFARARSASPCVLLFDDIDAIASNRDDDDKDSTNVQSRILSTLLNEMDGVSSHANRGGVLVVASTNRLSAIDTALLRPGRLEEHIELGLPSALDIEEILRLHLAKIHVDNIDVDTFELAKRLESVAASGADVEGVCTGACLRAIRRAQGNFEEKDKIALSQQDFQQSTLKSG